ncbi:MAG: hypothetical protein M3Q33_12230 [Acidobacteriota bacterium]|nr:hypothetical protein [Acidobacteriota bacterium]
MFYRKFFTLFLCFIFTGQSLAQAVKTDEPKKSDVSTELKDKSVALLNSLAREADQFSLPENRVGARIVVGNLLWEHDEKQSRSIFQNAIADLNGIIQQIPFEDTEAADQQYLTIYNISSLRSELLLALALYDPKAALDALQFLTRKKPDGENVFTDDQALELNLAAKITEKDPKQAYELAKKNLEKSLGYNLFSTLEDIYKKDTELGTKLAKDILAKIKSNDTKIISASDYAGNSNAAVIVNNNTSINSQITNFSVNIWEVQLYLETVKKLNRQAARDKKTAALSENEIKELVEILANKYVKQQYLSPYEVSKVMPEITKYFPASAVAIRRKMTDGSTELDNQIRTQNIQNETEDKTAEEIAQLAEKKPAGERDDFYRQAAEKAFTDGDLKTAKEYYAKVKKKPEYDYLGTKIEEGLPLALAKSGDLREVRQALAKLKTPEERIEILTTLSLSVMKSGDKKTANALLDEARTIYSGRMKNRKNLTSVLQLTQAYAVIDPVQSFAFLEGNLSFLNDIVAAGILLDEFNEGGSVKSEEVRLEVVRSESYRTVQGGVALIKNLANSDFDRTISLAEKFSRGEARFFARFRIAEALLDPNAEENEKTFQASIEGEGEEH